MNKLIKYTLDKIIDTALSEHLENRIMRTSLVEREENVSLNKYKIRRQIMINGNKVWVCGNTEQEYAERLLKLFGYETINPKEKHNFYEYAENWYAVFSKPNVVEATSRSYYQQLVSHVYPVLKEKNIEDISVSDIQIVFNSMGDEMKYETKHKVKVILNQIFKMAYEEGIIQRNPVQSSSLKVHGAASDTTPPYSVEEMKYMASHLDDISDERGKAWLALSVSLPMRLEEILGLRWQDIDEDTGIIHIRNTVTHPSRNEPYFREYTKTASSRRDLQLPSSILEYLPNRGADTDFIIGGEKPVSYTTFRFILKRISKEINFNGQITPRRFRTTVATDISASTHDIKLVQQMLGHSNPQMTLKHYDKGRNTAADASRVIEQCYGLATN